jgi:hypothetical protein
MTQKTSATPATLVDANQFVITGPIGISYDRTSFSGRPLFAYKDTELDLDFIGEEITRTDTPVGELVTVTLRDQVDAFVRTFTLVVPKVRLEPFGEVEFDTFGFETTDRSGAFVRAPGPAGVLQSYLLHELHGVARQVVA